LSFDARKKFIFSQKITEMVDKSYRFKKSFL